MKTLIVSALIASMAVSVQAQDLLNAEMGKPDPSLLTKGTYAIDTNHSISFTRSAISHFQLHRTCGRSQRRAENRSKDPEHGQVDIEIPLSGLVSTSTALDAHLKTSDFFDVETFPTAKFKSTAVKVNGTEAVISGLLTIRDITKPLELRAKLVGGRRQPHVGFPDCRVRGNHPIKRSILGVSYYVPHISDEVELRISVAFEDID